MRLRAIADELVLALPDLLADAERLHTLRQEWRRAKAKPGHAAALVKPLRREMEALAGSTASRVRSVAVALVGTLADAAAASAGASAAVPISIAVAMVAPVMDKGKNMFIGR